MEAYKTANGQFPKKVLIYRDGVGEGQLQQVKDVEVLAVKRCIERCDPSIKMAYIIVTKRINVRFFQDGGNQGVDNAKPGTVVDDVITCPEQ